METQLPSHGPAEASASRHADGLELQFLFHHDMAGDLSGSASAICLQSLRALQSYSEDAFSAADVSQPFASGQFRPIGRRLDGLRLSLEMWMADAGLERRGNSDEDLESVDNYLGEAASSKIRNIARACNQVGWGLRAMHDDFESMLEGASQNKDSSVERERSRVNSAFDNVEIAIRSLNGLINQVQMSRALRSGMGPYAQIRELVKSALHNPDSRDQDSSSIDTNHQYGSQVSDSSGDSVLTIHRQSQDAAKAGPSAHVRGSGHEEVSEKRSESQKNNPDIMAWGSDKTKVTTVPQTRDFVVPIEQPPRGSPFQSGRRRWWSHSRREGEDPGLEISFDRIEDHPLGYPRLASFMDSFEQFSMVRQYRYLQLRVILDQQDTLQNLEQELLSLDAESAEMSRTGISERNEESRELLHRINKTFSEYEPFMRKDDLITIFPTKVGLLERLTEDALTLLPSSISRIFTRNIQFRKTSDPTIHIFSPARVKLVTKSLLALLTGALLIGPTLIIVLADASEKAEFSSVVAFTVALGSGLLLLSDVNTFRALVVTAGYYALHVLFWSTYRWQR